jgi:preprotein translocase subunit Sss1
LRVETHTRAIEKLRKVTAKPDFGEYVESLILKDLGK